jgi:hypothetical protein
MMKTVPKKKRPLSHCYLASSQSWRFSWQKIPLMQMESHQSGVKDLFPFP